MSKADLRRLINSVDNGLAALPPVLEDRDLYNYCAGLELEFFEWQHGADVCRDGEVWTLSVGGVEVSSAWGAASLMRCWREAAHRQIVCEEAHHVQG